RRSHLARTLHPASNQSLPTGSWARWSRARRRQGMRRNSISTWGATALLGYQLLVAGCVASPDAPAANGDLKVAGSRQALANSCALLDDPTARALMSAMFERKLLERCDRLAELNSRALPPMAPIEPHGAGAPSANVQVNNSARDTPGSHTQS